MPTNAGEASLIPRSGRSTGEGNGNPLQYSCLENPRDEGAWWAAVYGVAQSQTRLKRLSSSSSSTTTYKIIHKDLLYRAQGTLKSLLQHHSSKASILCAAKSLQSCPTLCDPIDGSPPGSPVPGILQARILEWVAISFSNA